MALQVSVSAPARHYDNATLNTIVGGEVLAKRRQKAWKNTNKAPRINKKGVSVPSRYHATTLKLGKSIYDRNKGRVLTRTKVVTILKNHLARLGYVDEKTKKLTVKLS